MDALLACVIWIIFSTIYHWARVKWYLISLINAANDIHCTRVVQKISLNFLVAPFFIYVHLTSVYVFLSYARQPMRTTKINTIARVYFFCFIPIYNTARPCMNYDELCPHACHRIWIYINLLIYIKVYHHHKRGHSSSGIYLRAGMYIFIKS